MNEKNFINNAGLVITQSFLPTFFERLGLLQEKAFRSKEDQQKAVCYLQYLATGKMESMQTDLFLNKIICGLLVSEDIPLYFDLKPQEEELAEGLIKAIIDHWRAIGQQSVEGFRETWLIREGLLTEEENCWKLTVEKRAYDVLINQLPFSFSTIKFPWMEKNLYVNWDY